MVKKTHTQVVDGKTIKFGQDKTKKELSLDEDCDCNDLVQAIALKFHDAPEGEYPLGPCINGEDGRELILAPGWTFKHADKTRVKNSAAGSNFH